MRFMIFPGELSQCGARLQELGSKAGYLADLTLSGVDVAVPSWFLIRPSAFDASLDPAMARQLMSPEPDWDAFEKLRPADDILQELADAWRILGSPALLAVRASVPVDIGIASSDFTGVFESFCPVLPAVLPDRVADIWRSAFSDEAIGVRHRQQKSGVNIPAIMVQVRVNASLCGGVMTADPRNGDRSNLLVSAIIGGTDLWQALQQDGVLPNGRELLFCTLDPATSRTEPVQTLLSAPQCAAIRDMAMRVEAHFSAPVDIDWAIDQRGQLYLLQVRLLRSSMLKGGDNAGPILYWQNLSHDFPAGWADFSGLYAARLNHGWQVLLPGSMPPFSNIGGRLCLDRALFFAGHGRIPNDGIVAPPHFRPRPQAARNRMQKWLDDCQLKRTIPDLTDQWQRQLDGTLATDMQAVDPFLKLEQLRNLAGVAAILPYVLLLWPEASWARRVARLEHRWLKAMIALERQTSKRNQAPPGGCFYQQGATYSAEAWWPSDHQQQTFLTKITGLIAAAIDG